MQKVWVLEKFWKHLNSASKNTSETDIFPHGTKSLLTSVIIASSVYTTMMPTSKIMYYPVHVQDMYILCL